MKKDHVIILTLLFITFIYVSWTSPSNTVKEFITEISNCLVLNFLYKHAGKWLSRGNDTKYKERRCYPKHSSNAVV